MPLVFGLDTCWPLDLPRTPQPSCLATSADFSRLFVGQGATINIFPQPKTKLETKRRVMAAQWIFSLDLLLVMFDGRVEFWDTDLKPTSLYLNGEVNAFELWSSCDISNDDLVSDQLSIQFQDPNLSSDSISLATVNQDEDEANPVEVDTDVIDLVAIVCDTQIVLFKWINGTFSDKYSVHLANVTAVTFLNQFELHVVSADNPGDLVTINLQSQQVHHKDISQLNTTDQKGYFSFASNSLLDIVQLKSNLYLVKSNEIIKSHNFKLEGEYKLQEKLRFHCLMAPFVVLVFDSKIDVVSLLSFKVVQTIKIPKLNPIAISATANAFQVLTSTRIINVKMVKVWDLLDSLSAAGFFDEAIDLTLALSLANFKPNHNFSARELKFIKIRKYQLLKAQALMVGGQFNEAINLFIEYLAPPELVFKNLPSNVKNAIELSEEDDSIPDLNTETRDMLYHLINFLNDTKRKLLRLVDKSNQLSFTWKNLKISLLIYKFDNPDFKILDNLAKIDNYLFNCYLILNPKVINSFLRQKNYCSIELVEAKCKDFNYTPQLLEFYFNRGQTQKLIELLVTLEDKELKTRYLKKLLLDTPKNLAGVLPYILDILNDETFAEIFQAPSVEYTAEEVTTIQAFFANHNLTKYSIQFLEFVIFDQGMTNSTFTNSLFGEYFKDVDSNFDKIQALFKAAPYNATSILKTLRALTNGQPQLLKRLQVEPLLKLGKYEEIIEMLIVSLDDINGAVEFALRVRIIKNESLAKGLIFKILDLLLARNDELSIVTNLLQNPQLQFIDFEEILNKLPNRMTSNFLKEFLILNLKNMNEKGKNLIVRNENLKIKLINLNYKKVKYEKESTTVTQNTRCKKCGLRFNKSEILCFRPNNDIIHYGCSK